MQAIGTEFMDVKTLCLGLLSFEDASGYDLKKHFESLFRHFYSAGYGSIYPALADLAEAGLVRCREVPQQGRPDRKVYSITAEGRASFATALNSIQPQHKLRSEFLAMIYFADLMNPERLRKLMEDRAAELSDAIEHIEAFRRSTDKTAPAGARFVAGFSAALITAAEKYIRENKQMLYRKAPDAGGLKNATKTRDTAPVEERA